MKKKLVALLLCFVMALSLIPMTVWAEDMSWTWTVTVIGGKYCRADGTESSTNIHTINRHLDNSVSHEIGYKFEWNTSAGGSKYNGGWQLCLTVDGKVVERSTAYIYTKDMSAAEDTWTAPASSHTGSSSHSFTIYLSNYSTIPNKPTWNDLKNLTGLVKVHCTTADSGHVDKTYGLIDGSFTAATPVKQADGSYTSEVTIKDSAAGVDKYVAAYNKDVAAGHAKDTGHDLKVTVKWNGSNWGATNKTATINVKCTPAPTAPNAPTWDDLKNLTDLVKVHCTTADSGHADKTYGLIDGSFTAATPVKQADGSYTSEITIKDGADGVAKYVAAYNTDVAANHEEGTNHDLTIKLVWKDKQWGASPDGDTATIYVKCNPVPSAPSYDELKNIRGVLVDCLSDPQAITHSDMAFPFFENTYEVGDVVLDQGTDQYTCVVTVTDPQAYVNSYDFMLGLMLGKTDLIHHIMQPTTQTPTVTLVYDETNGWQRPERTYAIITAICMPKAPTAKDLEGKELVKVDCDTKISHSEKTYALLDGTFTTAVTVDKEGIFRCVITITQDGAKKYVEQYSKDLNKTHSLKELKDATITLKYEDNSWGVDDNDNSASILAKCSTGSNTTTGTDDGKTVTSQKTFDAGIALYAGLSILSLTGGALVIRKRKEF